MTELSKIEEKIKDVEAKFSQLANRLSILQGQRNEIDREIISVREQQLGLQGEYKAFTSLRDEEKVNKKLAEPTLEIPSGKNKK